jgi:DinB superfamily/Pentapeptide repeats (8 copies)
MRPPIAIGMTQPKETLMAEEFEGKDLSGSVFWGVDLSGARFRDVDMHDVSISHAWIVNLDIDGLVENVVINDVDVTQYVNERDPWYPLRAMLRPTNVDGMRSTWTALTQQWDATIERARHGHDSNLHASVDGEWSLAQTLRHLVFATDKWFSVPILGDAAFHPIGVPNSGSVDFDWPGLDRNASPTFDEILEVRADRVARLQNYLGNLQPADFTREVTILENGVTPLKDCIGVVFEEEFEHNRYSVRDLAKLT